MAPMSEILSILRFHIVLIAICAHLVFGWLIAGEYFWFTSLIVGLDWMLINLANRVSDVAEDMANRIPGAERISRAKTSFLLGYILVMAVSFVISYHFFPQITGWRVAIQIIGFLYSFKVIPTHRGRIRLKDLYFFKNFLSGLGFLFTCFGYTLALSGYNPRIGWTAVIALALFFLPFELTYEIFYDLRDIEGDRQENVHTYPVVHGRGGAIGIINGLLIVSTVIICGAFFSGMIGAREFLMVAAPAIQFALFRHAYKTGPTIEQCIYATHLGSGLLLFYLAGTAIWLRIGLPENLYL